MKLARSAILLSIGVACGPNRPPTVETAPATSSSAVDVEPSKSSGSAPLAKSPTGKSRLGSTGDRDGDGIADDKDKCPDDPEDFDGFQDADGCPDPDNDGDGILDINDACPNIPARGSADGCPHQAAQMGDRDGDGITDDRDKCPDDPEDRDGFQDADGCPDPDNDKDGIPDVKDRCPNEPETVNGFQDADGCPDKKPKK
jgi:hypothetical protein